MNTKTAISLPSDQFKRLESIRRKNHLSRSAIFQQLVNEWLKRLDEEILIQQYIAGYRKNPEEPAQLKAMARASAEAFKAEGLQ